MNINSNIIPAKNEIIKKLTPYLEEKNITQIAKAKNPTEYNFALRRACYDYFNKNVEETNMVVSERAHIDDKYLEKKSSLTLEMEQIISKFTKYFDTKLSDFYKILIHKDTNPKVKEIKKFLQEKYNIKELQLSNDLEFAKCLKFATLIAGMNGLKIPDKIYHNPYAHMNICLNTNNGREIMYGGTWGLHQVNSTEHPLHTLIHEIVHYNQPTLISCNIKKLSANDRKIANKISPYCVNNATHEIHAELLTKKILGELSNEEEQLLVKLNKALLFD